MRHVFPVHRARVRGIQVSHVPTSCNETKTSIVDICFSHRAGTPELASVTPSPFRADNWRKKSAGWGGEKNMKHARTITRKEVCKRVCRFLYKAIMNAISIIQAVETVVAFLKSLKKVLG
jgi:hypothetical protein